MSWGGQFQQDMMRHWWQPAAKSSGCDLTFDPDSWDGDYGALSAKITKGINDWDLVHVEAHYVENPMHRELFESFPDRTLSLGNQSIPAKDDAVPILEYGYVLAYNKDRLRAANKLTWKDFWDTSQFPGNRGVRDFPVGNIEIALLSLGRDIKDVLYRPGHARLEIEKQVDDALNRFDAIKRDITWWKTGEQLQRGLATGEMPVAAAWSGRVLSAYKQVCGAAMTQNCAIQANDSSALVSTDWWVIPKGSPQAAEANKFLECMYNDPAARKGAADFAVAQGYSVPGALIDPKNELANYYLNMGSSGNPRKIARIDEHFWGLNYEWINARWKAWRAK